MQRRSNLLSNHSQQLQINWLEEINRCVSLIFVHYINITNASFLLQNLTFEECCKRLEQLEKDKIQYLDMNSKEMAHYQDLKLKHQLTSTQVQKEGLRQMHQNNENCVELLSLQQKSIRNVFEWYGNQMAQLQPLSCTHHSTEQNDLRTQLNAEIQKVYSLNLKCKEILESSQRSGEILSQYDYASKLCQL